MTNIQGYEHYILYEGVKTLTDREYAKLGVEEGWLVCIDSFRDYRDMYVFTYMLKGESLPPGPESDYRNIKRRGFGYQ